MGCVWTEQERGVQRMREEVRGPKAGYLSEAKADYRQKVWCTLIGESVGDGYYICLPSSNGEEIKVMVGMGIAEDKIIAIDESAAILASAKWRKEFPRVKCYGNRLSRASARISADGHKIAAANLDLCNNLSDELIAELNCFFRLIECENVAITMMRGRESTALSLMVKKFGSDYGVDSRVGALLTLLGSLQSDRIYSIDVIHCEKYIHSRTPMLWFVLNIKYTGHKLMVSNRMEKFLRLMFAHDDRRVRLLHEVCEMTEERSSFFLDGTGMPTSEYRVWQEKAERKVMKMQKKYDLSEHRILKYGDIVHDEAKEMLRESRIIMSTREAIIRAAEHLELPRLLRSMEQRKNLDRLI